MGSFVVSALGRQTEWNSALMSRFEELFHNAQAPASVRGISLHVIGHNMFLCPRAEREAFNTRIRKMCDVALWDESNMHLRRGACLAAYFLGGYGKRIHELANDFEEDELGNTVASEAKYYDLDPEG
jgi:hypothetical protein